MTSMRSGRRSNFASCSTGYLCSTTCLILCLISYVQLSSVCGATVFSRNHSLSDIIPVKSFIETVGSWSAKNGPCDSCPPSGSASVSVEGYDSSFWCRQQNGTLSQPQWITVTCPADVVGQPTDARIPAYCCGTEVDKVCCEWSTFVVNSIGFGRTSLGLVFFVFLFFVGALFVVAICCACFRVCCVLRWEQQEQHHTPRNTDSRQSSFRPTRRGGSVDTIHSVPLLAAGDKLV